ncbi:MAG TPA: MFS transporter [Mycobacteriales bacterium]|nr:MFS transporter [Mycobacteriales bacterium]
MPTTPLALPRWARPSPLAPLVRLAVAAGAGDALVAVALANTVFFRVPAGEARGRVALYLLLTMAPFALVAPVVGPLLDRTRAGRRGALAVTFGGRAVLAWLMAQAPHGLRVYPAAFGILVLAKAYAVARAAAVPRLLPDGSTLVGANARLTASGIAASSVAGVVGLGVGKIGYGWTLRLAAVAFAAGAVLALRLPKEVNSAGADTRERVRAPRFPAEARSALLSAVSLRALAGFLTTYLAFLLRRRGSNLDIGLLVASVAVGSALGTGAGARLNRLAPDRLIVGAVGLAALCCAAGAWRYSVGTALLAALAAAVAGALAKIALDATVQVAFADDVRGQAFARSETVLQLAWVAGGGAGLALPLRGSYGLGLAAVALVAATVWARVRVARTVT